MPTDIDKAYIKYILFIFILYYIIYIYIIYSAKHDPRRLNC